MIPTRPPARSILALLASTLLLAACGSPRGLLTQLGPDYRAAEPPMPSAWAAPVQPGPTTAKSAPDASARLSALRQWWTQFDDPLLTQLIDQAQTASPSLALAASRVAQARAQAVAAGAAGLPTLDAIASVNRAAFTFGEPVALRSQTQLGVQASWEIDLFGGLARQREFSQAQFEGSVARWHEARVSVAAETAQAYMNYRHCEMQRALAEADATSRQQTARLTEAAAHAGFQSPSTLALAQGSAADASSTLTQRRTQCDLSLKALVALTAIDEATLRQRLAAANGGDARDLPVPQRLTVDTLPAVVVAQRPDVAAAERDVAAASAQIGVAEAARYPRLTLAGAITPTRLTVGSQTVQATTWNIGPNLTVPLIDSGRRLAANRDAARAAYDAAVSAYRAQVRQAVREVEEQLLTLDSLGRRQADVDTAAAAYRRAYEGAQARHRAGLGNLVELEDARRIALAAQALQAQWQLERVSAWIALYRAVGGGWEPGAQASLAAPPAPANAHAQPIPTSP